MQVYFIIKLKKYISKVKFKDNEKIWFGDTLTQKNELKINFDYIF
jgi:hypothetical protein